MADRNKKLRIIIIGGVATGPKTGATLARRFPDAEITLFQREKHISYGTCGMPYFASGDIGSFEELTLTGYGIKRDADFFKRTKGFNVITGAEVTEIDRDKKQVTVRMLSTDHIENFDYDKLVLAVGSTPVKPPFPIVESPNIRSFTRPDDAMHFRKKAEQGRIDNVVIVGGGFIGCELAEAAASLWGIDVTLIEKEKQLLPYILDPEMSRLVELEMKKQGIAVLTDSTVEKLELDFDKKPIVSVMSGETISTDYIFTCLGVRPEITLAENCGLNIGPTGGINVDDTMLTSDPDIYAGGDCVELTHLLTGRKIFMPMGSLANRHGRVIAENIAGNKLSFPGVLGAFLVKVFDINVGAVGLSERAALSAGLKVNVICASFMEKPDYYPESKGFSAKMVFEKGTGRLLGLQTIGAGDICRRIDTFSSFLQLKATINELLDFEHGYAPPYSEAIDPLHHLAALAIAQEKGLSIVKPERTDEPELIWLDVRETEETETSPWPLVDENSNQKLINIPLNDLRFRLNELPVEKKYMIVCRRGPRSYQAATILIQAGFRDVHIVGGGTSAVIG